MQAVTAVIPGGSSPTLLARVLGGMGTPITRASIAAIAWTVTDLQAGAIVGTGAFLTSTIMNGLVQNDPRWTLDGAYSPGPDGLWGYNWLAGPLAASFFPLAAPLPTPPGFPPAVTPRPYQIDVVFTPLAGGAFRLPPFLATVTPAYG